MFGTILAKLWRIYFIFHDPFRKTEKQVRPTIIVYSIWTLLCDCVSQQKVSDWRMSLIILGIVSIVVVLLIIGTVLPKTRPNAYTIHDQENPPRYVCIHNWYIHMHTRFCMHIFNPAAYLLHMSNSRKIVLTACQFGSSLIHDTVYAHARGLIQLLFLFIRLCSLAPFLSLPLSFLCSLCPSLPPSLPPSFILLTGEWDTAQICSCNILDTCWFYLANVSVWLPWHTANCLFSFSFEKQKNTYQSNQ